MTPRFNRKDIIILGLGIIGLVVFLMLVGKVHPSIAHHLKISKNQAVHIASQFLEEHGFKLEGYRQTAIYSEYNPGYLQRTLGTDQFIKIVSDLPLMYWEIQFSKEDQSLQFRVRVGPEGKIISFTHYVPDNAPGVILKQDQALTLVQSFIQKEMKLDLSKYSLTDSNSTEKEKRIDHSFTWEASSPNLGDSSFYLYAVVHGNTVDGFQWQILYPYKFTASLSDEKSKGEMLAKVSKEFFGLFLWAAVLIAVMANKDNTFPWKGFSLLALAWATVAFLQEINSAIPKESFDFNSLPSYIGRGVWIIDLVGSSLVEGVKAFSVAIAGWIVCLKVIIKIKINLIMRWRDFIYKNFPYPSIIGYLLACIGLGYVRTLYLNAENYLGVSSSIVPSLLISTAIVIAVSANKDKTLPWRGFSLLALAIVASGLVQDINEIPNSETISFENSSLYMAWAKWILDTLTSNFKEGVYYFTIAIAGWVLLQEVITKQKLNPIMRWINFDSKDMTYRASMGYLLAAIGLGYITVFYLIGKKYLGVWEPIGSGYSEVLNTYFPSFDPLTNSFRASVREELMFRFFAIALLLKYLRSRTLALFVSALIWGFGHSDYAVFPFYTRGIELTLVGLIDGYFFIQYGLITVIVAHFVYDAVIGAIPLLQSSILYYYWSGMAAIGVAALPVIFGMIITVRSLRLARHRDGGPRKIRMGLESQVLIDEKHLHHKL
jgi:Type II CAAX prenyl endopeptidase Rce1-like